MIFQRPLLLVVLSLSLVFAVVANRDVISDSAQPLLSPPMESPRNVFSKDDGPKSNRFLASKEGKIGKKGKKAKSTKAPSDMPSHAPSSFRDSLGCPESVLALPADANMRSLIADCFNNNVCPDDLVTIGCWNTTLVESMYYAFYASAFNAPLAWDTSNVKNMTGMFFLSDFDKSLDNFDTSSVEDMSVMFGSSQFDKSLDNFDTSNVTDMNGMFGVSQFNKSLDNFDTSNVKDMRYMFYGSQFDKSLDNFNTFSVTDMSYMFAVSKFDKPLGNFDTSNVKYMQYMFWEASQFNQCLSSWDRSNADTTEMFLASGCLDQDPANNCAC